MKKCKHQWSYYDENFDINIHLPPGLNMPPNHTTINEFFRICGICMLKQRQNPWSNSEFKWEDTDFYNKEENREIKLREILKGRSQSK